MCATLIRFDRRSPDRSLGKGDLLDDRFMLVEILSSEGISTVYKAIDKYKSEANKLHYVAIEVLKKQYQSNVEWVLAMASVARKCQKLNHPNIAKTHGFQRDGTWVYLHTEYLTGESLSQKIRWGTMRIPVKQALQIVNEIGSALEYAHARGVVHDDLKPANVFLTDSGAVKVIDFGIAQALRITAKNDANAPHFGPDNYSLTTPSYASPEMLDLKKPDPRDDVYALACIAYELLAGRHPFGRVRATEARNHGLELRPSQAFTAAQWDSLQHALTFDLDQRTPTVAEFLTSFNASTRWVGRVSLAAGVVAFSIATILFINSSQQLVSKWPAKPDAMVELTTDEQARLTEQAFRSQRSSSLFQNDMVSSADVEIQAANTSGTDAGEPAPVKPIITNEWSTAQSNNLEPETDEFAAITEVPPIEITEKRLPGAVKSQSPDASNQSLRAGLQHSTIEPQPRDKRPAEQQVTDLLLLAQSHINARRLSTPAGNNALQTYREVLRLEPDNAKAKQGIQMIEREYSLWAQAARNKEERKKTKAYDTGSAAIVLSGSTAVQDKLSEFEQPSQAQQKVKHQADTNAPNIAKLPAPDPIPEPIVARPEPAVVINEFMASNSQTIADAQGGYDDWIELYNKSQEDIDLSGYYLSDNPKNLKQWRFPDGTTISANAYLMIWADRASGYTDMTAQPPQLHANFELSRRGEQLFLVNTDENGNSTIIDHISFGHQREDRSTGRLPNGLGEFSMTQISTPGRANPRP